MALKIVNPAALQALTAKAQKLKEKEQKYKQKLAQKPFRSEKEMAEIQHYFNMLFFSINFGKFATDALQKRGELMKATAMPIIMHELMEAVVVFRKKLLNHGEKAVTEFEDFLRDMEDFAYEYVTLTEDERIKTRKYVASLHKKRWKNKPVSL